MSIIYIDVQWYKKKFYIIKFKLRINKNNKIQ